MNILGNEIYFHHSILSLVLTQGTIEICSPYPKFVLTGVLSINKALKGTETVFVYCKYRCVFSLIRDFVILTRNGGKIFGIEKLNSQNELLTNVVVHSYRYRIALINHPQRGY